MVINRTSIKKGVVRWIGRIPLDGENGDKWDPLSVTARWVSGPVEAKL